MKEKLKSLNFTLLAFIAFTVKILVIDATIADSLIIAVLAGVYGYTQYLKRFQPYKLDDAVMKDLVEVKSALSKMNIIRATEKLAEKK